MSLLFEIVKAQATNKKRTRVFLRVFRCLTQKMSSKCRIVPLLSRLNMVMILSSWPRLESWQRFRIQTKMDKNYRHLNKNPLLKGSCRVLREQPKLHRPRNCLEEKKNQRSWALVGTLTPPTSQAGSFGSQLSQRGPANTSTSRYSDGKETSLGSVEVICFRF